MLAVLLLLVALLLYVLALSPTIPTGGALMLITLSLVVGIKGSLSGRRAWRLRRAPIEPFVVHVANDRLHARGGVRDHFLTIENALATRCEFPVSERIASRATRGDVGVAYLRDGVLVNFVRVRV